MMTLSWTGRKPHWIHLAIVLVVCWVSTIVDGAISGYSDSPTQYHIQTDEGPERFFRFQTYNGQYRRERRLDDGSVVGSYGWVDPAGFLRMTDYVADGKGYRIVKTRMEYVGVKPVPDEPEKKPYAPMKHATKVVGAAAFPFSTVVPFTNSLTPVLQKRGVTRNIDVGQIPKSSFDAHSAQIRQPSIKRLRQAPAASATSSASSGTGLGNSGEDGRSTFKRPIKSRIIRVYRRPVANKFSSTFEAEPTTADGIRVVTKSRPANPHLIRTIDDFVGERDVFKKYVTPLKRRPGFLYKIPNQYHKEETGADGSRNGSFGYVDPYGIRRVIHYNAGKDGFEHEKDFEYVGKQY